MRELEIICWRAGLPFFALVIMWMLLLYPLYASSCGFNALDWDKQQPKWFFYIIKKMDL